MRSRGWRGVAVIMVSVLGLCAEVFAGGNLFVADQNMSVRAFDAAANGDASPLRVIAGTNTLFARQYPKGIAVDDDFMYVTLQTSGVVTASGVGVFPLQAEGDVSPTRLIAGDQTQLSMPQGIAVDTQFIYVANYFSDTITVYPLDADGNIAPTGTVSGGGSLLSSPYDVAVDDQYLYVANFGNNSITVYEKSPLSSVPVRCIQGALTGLERPQGIAVNASAIFVTDMSDTNQVKAFALNADSNTAPIRIISGDQTGLFGTWGIDVDDQYLYVGNFTSVSVFSPTDDGNTPPVRLIEGVQPGILFAQGVAVRTDWGRDGPEPEHTHDALDNWRWRNPIPNGSILYGIVYGEDRFVAVGRDGAAFYSLDGITWEAADAGSNTLEAVTWADGQFMAVGSKSAVVTSPDGVNWTERSVGTPRTLKCILHTGSKYVAGASGEVLTSPDGTNWTRYAIEPPTSWDSIAQGNGILLLAGWSYTNGAVLRSTNGGSSWAFSSMPGDEYAPWDLAYGNGLFVLAGYDQINREALILTSPTGTNWTRQTVPAPGYRILRAVTFGDGVFTAAGGSADDIIYTSTDGTNWTDKTPGLVAEEFYAVCHGAGRFAACGAGGLVECSVDGGDSWSVQTPGTRDYFDAVAYGAGRFVAVAFNRTNYFSRNGVTWEPIAQTSPRELADIVYADDQFVGVGLLGCIVTSPDGVTWTTRDSGVFSWLRDVDYLNGAFYAVGLGGVVLRSADGAVWQTLENFGDDYEGIAYGDGMFVAVGNDMFGRGVVAYSADADNWTIAVNDAPDAFKGVQYGAGRFIVVGANKMVLSSEDGIHWSQESDLWDGAQGLHYINDLFLCPADTSIMTSSNGVDWITRVRDLPVSIRGMAYGRGSYVGVGAHGNILQCGLAVLGDFEGNGKADWADYVPDSGRWMMQRDDASRSWERSWGWSEAEPVIGDYDGDGISDIAVFWPDGGTWYLLFSAGGGRTIQYGWNECLPVPGDYDGDGQTDIGLYYPDQGHWYILGLTGASFEEYWGWSEAAPVPGDYDGDGWADLAVYHAATGMWSVKYSGGGGLIENWGWIEARPVPADYDGDGKTDIAVYWPRGGTWYVLYSGGGSLTQPWGWSEADPVPADYDGDGRADIAVRTATDWYVLYADGTTAIRAFGAEGAEPVLPQSVINERFYE